MQYINQHDSKHFSVLTINALGLIYATRLNEIAPDIQPYTLDISQGYPAYVKEEIRDDNGLFHQICLLRNDKCDNECSSDSSLKKSTALTCLRQLIIVVDFGDAFDRMQYEQNDINDVIKSIHEDSSRISWGRHLSVLLDPGTGITIRFPDKSVHKFIPFDKSASMAKRSHITYINCSIQEELDKRLCLDIDFRQISLCLSKYYAYRGLYLTSGARIEKDNDKFALNEKTVIVLPDLKLKPTDDFGGDPFVLTQTNKEKPNINDKYEFAVLKESVEVTAFDGEGFICPDYALYIQECLDTKATSFQIRMPFVKGILNTADFHAFIKDKSNKDDAYITDFIGIKRNLKDARIIINESMFKCHSWLEKYKNSAGKSEIDKEYGGDAMRYFFSKIDKYGHSMYISGSNASFHPNGYEHLNYQFIDSLKISHSDIEELVNDHIRNSTKQLYYYLHPDENPFDKQAVSKAKPYIAAACKNPIFYKESRLIDDAKQQVKNIKIDCGLGALCTEGEHRYLSADLMAYFLYIQALCEGKKSADIGVEFFANKKTLNGHFYMPQYNGSPLKLKNNEFYALFRSPHLSRNEECLLKAYIPDAEDDYTLRTINQL